MQISICGGDACPDAGVQLLPGEGIHVYLSGDAAGGNLFRKPCLQGRVDPVAEALFLHDRQAGVRLTCIQPDKQSALRCQQAEHQQNSYNNVCEVFAGCLHGFCPSVS